MTKMTKKIMSLFFAMLLLLTGVTVYGVDSYEVIFSDLVFTDALTGSAVGNPLPKTVNMTGSIQSTRESFSAWLIVAMYTSDGILVGVDAKPQSVNQGVTLITASVENTTDKAAGKLMCFLWDSETTLDPVTKTAEFVNGSTDYHGPAAEYYVSVGGSADGDGSAANPFDSIATAKEYINTVKNYVDGDITVHVEAGEYFLTEPITFGYEDSAVNGNKIIYRGEEGTLLSGGERVTGWTRGENGIYYVSLPGRDYIGELYADNKSAQRANTEELVYPLAFYNDGTADVGFVVSYDQRLATIQENDKAEVTSLSDWRCHKYKIEKVFPNPADSSQLIVLLEDGAEAIGRFKGNNGSDYAGYGVRIENAIGLLDQANEFYFDKLSDTLYYKPPYGIDANNQEIYIPNLEALLVLRGEHSGKRVTGITFDGFDFRHTTWKRGETDMYYAHQGVMIYNDVNNNDYLFPQAGMVPAAIQADAVDGFCFTNNTVACVGASAVGLYNDVHNSDVTGNLITQAAHSGVSAGVTGLMYSDRGYNVAYRKPATASSYVKPYPPVNLTDGDIYRYHWQAAVGANDTENTKHWCQVDLLKPYNISAVGLHTWGASVEQSRNFRILASNDPTFTEKTVLLGWYTNQIAVGSMTRIGAGGTIPFTYTPAQGETYRYVRFEHRGATGAALGDFAVYTNDEGDVRSKEELTDNTISNNYISNIGLRYADGIGVQTLYTKRLAVSNNVIKDAPYSAISVGWGWENAHTWGTTSVSDNIVSKNKIMRSLRQLRDGAAIYVVGEQPGLKVEENYIKDTKNSFGGIYPDNGAAGTSAKRMSVKNNVVEGGPMWFHGWHPSAEYMDVMNNYTTVTRQKNALNNTDNGKYPSGNTCTVDDNYVYVISNPPAEATALMDAAGITAQYDDIYRRLVPFGENGEKIDMERLEMSLGVTNLVDTFVLTDTGRTSLRDTLSVNDVDYWMNHGNRLVQGSGSHGAFKTENLEHVIATYNYYKILLQDNSSWDDNYQAEVAALDAAISAVKSVYNSSAVTIRDIYQARVDGENALKTFARSGIFYGKSTDATTRELDNALINRIGYSWSQ